MWCNRISENPRKGFHNRWIGGWTKSKNEYYFELYITKAFFCPLSWNFTTTRSGAVFGPTLMYMHWQFSVWRYSIKFWFKGLNRKKNSCKIRNIWKRTFFLLASLEIWKQNSRAYFFWWVTRLYLKNKYAKFRNFKE